MFNTEDTENTENHGGVLQPCLGQRELRPTSASPDRGSVTRSNLRPDYGRAANRGAVHSRVAAGHRPAVRAMCLLAAFLLAGCASYVEQRSPQEGEGQPAAPGKFSHADDSLKPNAASDSDTWWKAFKDPTLDSLMQQLEAANPDLEAALARVDQSLAALGISRGPLLPTITADAAAGRRRDSVNNLLFPIAMPEYERYRLGMSATWELDLWGRVRGAVKRDSLRAEASELEYRAALLSMQGELARQYFAWRTASRELRINSEAVRLREENLKLQQSRLELGSGVEIDVARARVELSNASAGEEAAARNVGKIRHAIAALIGQAPADFTAELAADAEAAAIQRVAVPAGVPSELLNRRADLRAADRSLRAAAVQVGIRKADFLPRITLNGSGGVASLRTSNLFDSGSGFFDVGPQIDVPVFQSGRRKSSVAEAKAQWREASANYRGALLTAVREVDDALLDLKSLAREAVARSEVVTAAIKAAEAAKTRHESGLANYFEVIDAERDRLQARLAENALHGMQQAASVNLIQALGGGW